MTVMLTPLQIPISANFDALTADAQAFQTTMSELSDVTDQVSDEFSVLQEAAVLTWSEIGSAADVAIDGLSDGLARFITTGKFGFGDLKKVGLDALASLADGLFGLVAGSVSGGEGIAGALFGSIGGILGFSRGGPVSPGRPYVVGEQGPEMFFPATGGQVVPRDQLGQGMRAGPVITINITGVREEDDLRRSARQLASAVRRGIIAAER